MQIHFALTFLCIFPLKSFFSKFSLFHLKKKIPVESLNSEFLRHLGSKIQRDLQNPKGTGEEGEWEWELLGPRGVSRLPWPDPPPTPPPKLAASPDANTRS